MNGAQSFPLSHLTVIIIQCYADPSLLYIKEHLLHASRMVIPGDTSATKQMYLIGRCVTFDFFEREKNVQPLFSVYLEKITQNSLITKEMYLNIYF